MCGIVGYFTKDGRGIPPTTFEKMGKTISHRGPDGRGSTSRQGVGIGNERLSIIDLQGGKQPFFSEDGEIAIVQNGEIYNYIELAQDLRQSGYPCKTHSDTEVLLKLYEREGIDFVHRLNGMFAIAIHDRREKALYLIRDRMGVKPLYLWEDGNLLLFASEIKAILAAGVKPTMDESAIHHFLTFNYVPVPLTAFQGIRHLEPGHWMKITSEGTETRRWWQLSNCQSHPWSEADTKSHFLELLEDSIRLRMRSDVPFGAFLSGGLDSSSVVAHMGRHQNTPVKTFTIGFDDQRFDESQFAQDAADRFETQHVMDRVSMDMVNLWPLILYHCDQPHGDVSFMPYYQVSKTAAKHVTMVLTGDGGDELFGGYEKYVSFFGSQASQSPSIVDFQRGYHHAISLFTEQGKREIYKTSFQKNAEGLDSFDISRAFLQQSEHMDRINQALYLDCMQLLPGNNLVKPDRMPMAASLEARSPFMDYRFVEFAFSIPGHFKIQNGETRYIYKRAVENLIGKDLTYRKKQMFTVPIGEWFKDKLKPFTNQVLLSERCTDRGIFERTPLRAMLKAHEEGRSNFTREIRALLAVELWARIFLDQSFKGETPTLESIGIAQEEVMAR